MRLNRVPNRQSYFGVLVIVLSLFFPAVSHSLEIKNRVTNEIIDTAVTIPVNQVTRLRVDPIPNGGKWPIYLVYNNWRADVQFVDNGDGSRDFVIRPTVANQQFDIKFKAKFDGWKYKRKTIRVNVAGSQQRSSDNNIQADFEFEVRYRTVWVTSTVPTHTYPASAGLKYFWSFNDRNDPDPPFSRFPTGMGGSANHRYSEDGRYSIGLKVCDIFDRCSSIQRSISIPDSGAISPPSMTSCRNPRPTFQSREYSPVCAYHPINNQYLIYPNRSVACSNRYVSSWFPSTTAEKNGPTDCSNEVP